MLSTLVAASRRRPTEARQAVNYLSCDGPEPGDPEVACGEELLVEALCLEVPVTEVVACLPVIGALWGALLLVDCGSCPAVGDGAVTSFPGASLTVVVVFVGVNPVWRDGFDGAAFVDNAIGAGVLC